MCSVDHQENRFVNGVTRRRQGLCCWKCRTWQGLCCWKCRTCIGTQEGEHWQEATSVQPGLFLAPSYLGIYFSLSSFMFFPFLSNSFFFLFSSFLFSSILPTGHERRNCSIVWICISLNTHKCVNRTLWLGSVLTRRAISNLWQLIWTFKLI